MAYKKPGVLVTPGMLRRAGACSGYLRKFHKKFPRGFRVTEKAVEALATHGLFRDRGNWAAEKLLNYTGQELFKQRMEPFRRPYLDNDISTRAFNFVSVSVFVRLFLNFQYRNIP